MLAVPPAAKARVEEQLNNDGSTNAVLHTRLSGHQASPPIVDQPAIQVRLSGLATLRLGGGEAPSEVQVGNRCTAHSSSSRKASTRSVRGIQARTHGCRPVSAISASSSRVGMAFEA